MRSARSFGVVLCIQTTVNVSVQNVHMNRESVLDQGKRGAEWWYNVVQLVLLLECTTL